MKQQLAYPSLAVILLAFFAVTLLAVDKGNNDTGPLTWMKYDDAVALAKKENRHILINFTTKWCGWCKKMKKITYRDSMIVATLNNHFALAVVDGDSYDMIKLNDGDITERGLTKKYFVKGYPTTWFLEPNGDKIAPVGGFVDQEQMQYILDFVWTDANEKMSFHEFVEQEKSKRSSK